MTSLGGAGVGARGHPVGGHGAVMTKAQFESLDAALDAAREFVATGLRTEAPGDAALALARAHGALARAAAAMDEIHTAWMLDAAARAGAVAIFEVDANAAGGGS